MSKCQCCGKAYERGYNRYFCTFACAFIQQPDAVKLVHASEYLDGHPHPFGFGADSAASTTLLRAAIEILTERGNEWQKQMALEARERL